MVENSLPHHSFKALRMAENKMAMDWLEKYILSLLKKTTTIHSLFFFNWPISLNPLTQSTYVGRGRRFCVYGTFKSNLITFDGKYAEAACGIVVFWALSPCLVSVIYSACFACAGKHDCAVSPLCRCPQLVLGNALWNSDLSDKIWSILYSRHFKWMQRPPGYIHHKYQDQSFRLDLIFSLSSCRGHISSILLLFMCAAE